MQQCLEGVDRREALRLVGNICDDLRKGAGHKFQLYAVSPAVEHVVGETGND